MADNTPIEWTDATWNIITGCTIKSPGCKHCYAMKLAGTRLQHHPSRAGLTIMSDAGPVWNGKVRFNTDWLDQPISWTRPRDIFVCAHGDLFHEAVPFEWLVSIFDVMRRAPQHRFQCLTKRPEVALAYLTKWGQLPLRNVLIGVSVERQQEADERLSPLVQVAALGWRTWVSYEPALGPVDWSGWEFIRWMVSGGESDKGPRARPSHPDWHRATRDWCRRCGIPYLFKQWGDWIPGESEADADGRRICYPDEVCDVELGDGRRYVAMSAHGREFLRVGKAAAGRLLDGVEHNGFPEVV